MEEERRHRPYEGEPLHPLELPPPLKEWLREQPLACVMEETDAGTVHIVKAPAREIQSLRGAIPIGVDYELYAHPLAPVIRTVIRFYDQPQHPLVVETFANVEDPQQRSEFARLADQPELYMLFYDEQVRHRLSKVVPNGGQEHIRRIVQQAEQYLLDNSG